MVQIVNTYVSYFHFRIQLIIEDDGEVTKEPIEIMLNPGMTVAQLKSKIKADFNHAEDMQKFIFNDAILNEDQKTLTDYGMSGGGQTNPKVLKLFIVGLQVDDKTREESPKRMNSKYYLAEADQFSDDENLPEAIEEKEEEGATALPPPKPENPYGIIKGTWICPLCTLINAADKWTCSACSKTKPMDFKISAENKKAPIHLQKFTAVVANNLSRPNSSTTGADMDKDKEMNIKTTTVENVQGGKKHPPPPVIVGAAVKLTEDPLFLTKALGNPNITRNRYRGVDNFNPKHLLKGGSTSPVRSSQIPVKRHSTPKSPNALHLELLQLNNNKDVVENTATFECPICFGECQPGNGVVLRDCLHSFCRECLSSTVEHSEEAEIKCPYMDNAYSCDCVLQEREIRAVVTQQIYEKHLTKSIREAENKIENAFHCKTPNCRGWCIYEDNVNVFKCPICSLSNCLTCQAIHDGLNCQQYQDQMKNDSDTNQDAKQTKDMLEAMVKDGEAMNCPTCQVSERASGERNKKNLLRKRRLFSLQVIVMKKWGCDWLKCSMCKTEICWVTRGPRWGPAGKGDISDGCKCGVFGKKCHAKCTYCH